MQIRWQQVSLGFAALAMTVAAEDRYSIHGYGSWGYGNTDNDNHYMVGDPDGDYSYTDFALNISATPVENTFINAQGEWEVDHGETRVDLNFAFAEYRVSDPLRFRVGMATHPFGLYSEVLKVGTVRPFFFLPQSLYGPSGLVGDNYKGAGLTGFAPVGSKMSVRYDLYGGQLAMESESNTRAMRLFGPYIGSGAWMDGVLPSDVPGMDAMIAGDTETGSTTDNLIGGRAIADTPVQGLSVGVSGYSGQGTGAESGNTFRHQAYGASAAYLQGPFDLRSEAAHLIVGDELDADMAYVEGAWRVAGPWQMCARYDWLSGYRPSPELTLFPALDNLLEHREVAVGLNYWFSPNLVVKASYHWVTGNVYAGPLDMADLLDALASDTISEDTQLMLVGAQFSF